MNTAPMTHSYPGKWKEMIFTLKLDSKVISVSIVRPGGQPSSSEVEALTQVTVPSSVCGPNAVVPNGHRMIKEATKRSLLRLAIKHITPGSRIDTDSWRGYNWLKPLYDHRSVKHSECYVKDEVHCNPVCHNK